MILPIVSSCCQRNDFTVFTTCLVPKLLQVIEDRFVTFVKDYDYLLLSFNFVEVKNIVYAVVFSFGTVLYELPEACKLSLVSLH